MFAAEMDASTRPKHAALSVKSARARSKSALAFAACASGSRAKKSVANARADSSGSLRN